MTGWTKAVLRHISGVGQPRETDSSLSHCTVFRHMMPLSWFVLGSFYVSSLVHSVLVLQCCRILEQQPQAEILPGNSTGFLVRVRYTLLSSCPIGILNIGLATTFLSSIRKYSNIYSFELELFYMTNEQFVSTLMFSSFVLTLPLLFSPEWYSCLFIEKRFLFDSHQPGGCSNDSLSDLSDLTVFFFYLALPVQEGYEKMNCTHASLQALHPPEVSCSAEK